jgi:hypothetical protein
MHGAFGNIGMAGHQKMDLGNGSHVWVQKTQPTLGDVHVNTVLSNLSVAFMQDEGNFIADRAFPIVPVSKKTNLYRTYDRSFWTRDEMEKRADATETAGIGHGIGTASYSCDVWGLHEDIGDQTRANNDDGVDLDMDATSILSQMALIRKERAWATDFFTTSVWTQGRTGVASGEVAGTSVRQWNDPSSTPIEDVRAACTAMRLLTAGKAPNKLVLGWQVLDALLDHPDIVDRVKYSGGVGNRNPADVDLTTLAQLFKVPEILPMAAVYNTAKEGQTASYAFVGGKNALLLHTPQSPGIRVPSAGYTFSWTGYTGATANGSRIKRYRLPESLAADRVEIEIAFDQSLISADLGFFYSAVVA